MILCLPSIAIANDIDPDPLKPITQPITVNPTTPNKVTPRTIKPSGINDGANPTTTSDPNAIDPVELSQKADKDAEFDLLKGELPCLDSSSSCISLLTDKAIANSTTLKNLDQQIVQNQTNVKAIAESAKGNFFTQIQPFVSFLSAPIGLGSIVGSVFDNLAGNARTDQTIAQNNATLQIRIAEIERSKLDAKARIEDSVISSLIQFDTLKVEADISVAIANRESSRFKLIEIGYRLGEGDTNSFIALQNGLDRTRLAVTRNNAGMRSQAAKIKRIVLGDEG